MTDSETASESTRIPREAPLPGLERPTNPRSQRLGVSALSTPDDRTALRIGISTSVIQRGKTGIAQYVFALLRALRAYADHHRFVLFVLKDDMPLFDFVGETIELIEVPERFRPPIKNILWHQAMLPRIATAHRLDVLHIPSYRRLLWPRPCHLVATIHDLAPFHVAKKYDWWRMFYGRVISRRLAQRQEHLIAISENTARDVTSFLQVPKEKITVIHNGLDHGRFSPGLSEASRTDVAREHGIQTPFFLYLARLEHPGKNHVRLIQAFEVFKGATRSNWQLVFCGSDWEDAEVIHAAIKRSRFSKDIRTLGFVPDAALPNLYRAAEVFVYPSLYEGFGMPPLEAMACGCPVISSPRGSLAEVLGQAAVMVEPEDVQALASQLSRLATDGAIRTRLRAAGLLQAQKFDWRRTAAETLNVYQRAANRKA